MTEQRTKPMPAPHKTARPAPLVRGWRWRIASGPELPFNWVLPIGEALRDLAQETRFVLCGSRRLPACLHGPAAAQPAGRGARHSRRADGEIDIAKTTEHAHAFWLPEDEDADGIVDHLLVHAAAGLDPAAIRTLACCHRLILPGHGAWELLPEWMGEVGNGGLYGPARVWLSRSPWFAAPNVHRLDAGARIRRELALRGWPEPVDVARLEGEVLLGGRPIMPDDFFDERRSGALPLREPAPGFFRLSFGEAVYGPLCLGFAAHFGLGQFAPADD